jgi:hypothetical protein
MAYREQSQPRSRTTNAADEAASPVATGFALFAGMLMIMSGTFQAFQGLAAILEDEIYIVTQNYAYDLDVTTWGWVHLIVGVVVALAGFYVFTGAMWARLVGITAALIAALVNFMYIPYYPIWSVLIIALNVTIIWALASFRAPNELMYEDRATPLAGGAEREGMGNADIDEPGMDDRSAPPRA